MPARPFEPPSLRCPRSLWRWLLAGLRAALLMGAATAASALTLAEYEHTSWGAKEGVASVAWTQSAPNGMLKLTTSIGDQVFDGAQFYLFAADRPAPLADYAGALGQRSPTGAIYFPDPVKRQLMRQWNGRTEVVDDRAVRGVRSPQLVFDLDGIGWFQSGQDLYRLDGLTITPIDASWGITRATYGNPVVDARGTTWVATDEGAHGALYYLPRGARRFERFAEPVACFPAAVAPDGSLWCANDRGIAAISVVDGRPVSLRFISRLFVSFIAFDPSGGFWAASMSGGLAHLADWRVLLTPEGDAALAADTMRPTDGLSSDGIWSIRADAAGNVWVSTGSGLERFRARPFTPVRLPRIGWGAALAPDPDGSLWAGNFDGPLMHVADGGRRDVPEIRQIRALRHDAQGRLWVTGKFGVWRKDPGAAFVRVDGPSAASIPQFTEIAEDDAGAIWFRHTSRFMRLKDGRWSAPDVPEAPPPTQRYFMLSDAQRQLWFIGSGRVYVLRKGALRMLDDPAYARLGSAYCAHVRGPRVWVGAASGVGAFIGDAFYPLKLITDDAQLSITGIVETPGGDLWLHGLGKAYRIAKAQVEAGLQGQAVAPEVFDYHDGLRAVTSAYEPRPTLVQDTAGRLWFSTTQGLFWVDPNAPRAAEVPPPRTVLGPVTSDGQLMPAGSAVTLPPNPGQTEFSYAAAALGISDRVRFRYRIEGIDDEWREVGARRTAYYTRLPPGQHRFEVMASNEQGQWAAAPATLTFEVQRAWYQTRAFQLAVVTLSVLALWLIYRMRVSVLAARERARLQAISTERERIARDLHDTLLQSMQGVILSFHGLATRLPAQDEVRQSIEGNLDYADQMLGEARDRVRNLRAAGGAETGLREAFEQIALELADAARVHIAEEGVPRPLQPAARDGLYLVGREALLNAATHGRGTDIDLRLQFTPRRLVLRVRDNGVGIDPAVLAAGARPGHFGLPGMRERAAQLGGTFRLLRVPSGGTEVLLELPAARAYDTSATGSRWRWPRGIRTPAPPDESRSH